MTFLEKYRQEQSWLDKVIVMELYHLAATSTYKDWTLEKTAIYFEVSIGLVSENLRLAEASHVNPTLVEVQTRQEALERVRNASWT